MQVDLSLIMNNFVAEIITAKGSAESERLTSLKQAELTKIRSADLTAAIEKIVSKRKLKGDRIVFRTDEEFARAGMKILEKYNATDSEKKWFLSLV